MDSPVSVVEYLENMLRNAQVQAEICPMAKRLVELAIDYEQYPDWGKVEAALMALRGEKTDETG